MSHNLGQTRVERGKLRRSTTLVDSKTVIKFGFFGVIFIVVTV